jgi:hypothetical protein
VKELISMALVFRAPQPAALGAFLAAFVLLDFYDISLPRGDSIGVVGALGAAALVILGPLPTTILMFCSEIAASALRRKSFRLRQFLSSLGSRLGAIGVAAALLHLYQTTDNPLWQMIVVPGLFLLTDLVVAQALLAVTTGRSVWRLIRGNLDSQAPLVVAQWSTSVLMLVTYGHMTTWSLIPVVALLLLMRQSYALFLDVRETYRTTVEVLVEAAESQDARRHGHAERTAFLARAIAMRIGLSATEVERISYAALLHDLGELSEADPSTGTDVSRLSAADVVRGVEFLKRVEPILRISSGNADNQSYSEEDLLAGMIVALANDIDADYHDEVAAAHTTPLLHRTSAYMTPAIKAKAVGAALGLGYRVPAVS